MKFCKWIVVIFFLLTMSAAYSQSSLTPTYSPTVKSWGPFGVTTLAGFTNLCDNFWGVNQPVQIYGPLFTYATVTYYCSVGGNEEPLDFYIQSFCPSGSLSADSTTCTCPPPTDPTTEKSFYDPVGQKCFSANQVPATPWYKPINLGCPSCSSGAPPISTGDPVHIGTGNVFEKLTDIAVSAPSSDLRLQRTYNSSPAQNAIRSFGTSWTQSYDVSIIPLGPVSPANVVLFAFPEICWQRTDNGYIWCEYPVLDSNGPKPQMVSVVRANGKGLYFISGIASGGTMHWTPDVGVTGQLTSTMASDGVTPTNYIFTDTDNHSETYDANGLLLNTLAQNGSTQQMTYSTGTTNDSSVGRYPATAPICPHVQAGAAVASGTLLCVTDNWGRQLQFEHGQPGVNESVGRITLAIDPNNQVTQYGYDGPSAGCMTVNGQQTYACLASNLTSITYPDGKTKTLYYNEAAQINGGTVCPGSAPVGNGFGYLLNTLTGIVDENGNRSVSWSYDCNGIATASQLGGGVDKYQFNIGPPDANGNSSSTVISPLGTQMTYGFTSVNGLMLGSSFAQSAGSGSGAATAISTFDTNGNPASYTDFKGNVTNYTYDMTRNLELTRVDAAGTAQARTITTSWNPTYRLPAQVAEPLHLTTYTYDTNGNLLSKTQQATSDANGSQGLSATVTGTPRSWKYTYNSVGQVLTITGPRTDVTDLTQFGYDTYGNLSSVTNAAGQITTLSNYDLNGHVGSITDPNGLTTTYVYSPRGWLTSQSKGSEVTSYNYDGVGQLISVTFPNQAKLTYTYDAAHRLTSIADNLGNTVNYTLDAMGNRTLEQVNEANGNLTRQISRVVDALNRLQQITGAQ
ncbi:DUF6531 domain-containing protein [Solimicrobium silvestre]|uniref:YD repeat (Two copies) n=1 Tax=Solimicrobium silvestre TaxID=2099400 RepID=A0A2S9GYB0_9BURK|nr:DUF6531 domain-containing protein [Solimicrobium silvestre]PRC92703.1 YD repeat (two copies) [Solimicrobium silvestre]